MSRDLSSCGILQYTHLPPEVLTQPPAAYTPDSEMYSVGILMWEMWTGSHAYWQEINQSDPCVDTVDKFVIYIERNRPHLRDFYGDGEKIISPCCQTWLSRFQQCWSETERINCKALLQLLEEGTGVCSMPMAEHHFATTTE